MESSGEKNRDFPDLEEGIYCFRGGYLIIEGASATVLRHDDQYQNLQHLIKKHRLRKDPLTDEQLKKIHLPPKIRLRALTTFKRSEKM